MKTNIKTSHGIALLTACFFLSLLFINWTSKQIDLISLSITPLSQVAALISDFTPPVISSVQSSGITPTSATISWNTNEPATSQIEYGLSSAYGANTAVISSLTTTHSITFSNLLDNTIFDYRVRSKDAVGNLSISGNFSFTTPKIGSSQPVSPPPATPPVVQPVTPTVPVVQQDVPVIQQTNQIFSAASAGGQPLVLTDFLSMNNGGSAPLTKEAVTSMTVGSTPATWQYNPGYPTSGYEFKATTTMPARPLHGPVQVAGNVINDIGNTLGYQKTLTTATDEESIEYTFPTNSQPRRLSLGMYVYFSSANGRGWAPDCDYSDLLQINRGAGVDYHALNVQTCGSTTAPIKITNHPNGCSSGQEIYRAKRDTWYWITMLYDGGTTRVASMKVFDPVTWTELGSGQCSISNDGGPTAVANIAIGQSDNHGNPNRGNLYYMDDLMIDTGNAVFPLIPGPSEEVTPTTHTLTINKNGSAASAGTVTGTGINCGIDCAETLNAGTVVTLTPTPGASTFNGWSGAGCSGTGNCVVTLNAATTITATFDTVVSGNGAINCDLSTVQSAVNNASAGGTVTCKPGSWTWNGTLSINKGVILKGAPNKGTVINSNTSGYLIDYDPSNYTANTPFRVSGFVFDFTGSAGGGIDLGRSRNDPPFTLQTNVRIDNNTFRNQRNWSGNGVIRDLNVMRGVIDNNIFDQDTYIVRVANPVSGDAWWNYAGDPAFHTLQFGQQNASMYYEDNTINKVNDTGGTQHPVAGCQYSGRYIFRYNNITVTGDQYPLFDLHGNATAGDSAYSCFGTEMYANKIVNTSGETRVIDQRGGRAIIFGNEIQGSSANINIRSEKSDSINPVRTTNLLTGRPYTQHVTESYYWNNKRSGNIVPVVKGSDNGTGYNSQIVPNVDYFSDGAGSISVGSRANRPATCTPGGGYWETNDSNSGSLSGKVGVGANAQTGSLYRCATNGTWPATPFYTPLAYPHPIRTNCTLYPSLCDVGSIPVNVAPSITGQPTNQSVTVGSPATFSVNATGVPSPTYQWQRANPGSSSFTDINGATGSTYTTTNLSASNDNTAQYRVVIRNSVNSITSPPALLTVTSIIINSGIRWVSPTGTATWANCANQNPLSGTATCSMATANSGAIAGDTIYMRAGTYTTAISPTRSGTSDTQRIVYRAYNGEVPLFTVSPAITFNNRSYITVDDITARSTGSGSVAYANIDNGSHHNIIENSTMDQSDNRSSWPEGVVIQGISHHNILRNNIIGRVGYSSSKPDDIGELMRIGNSSSNPPVSDQSNYNLIEGNTIFFGGHAVLSVGSSYNVIRNNYFHNEEWNSCNKAGGKCGNRMVITDVSAQFVTGNIFEDNIFAFSGLPADDLGSSALSIRTPSNIVRRNIFIDNDENGLTFNSPGYNSNSSLSGNRAYNNTFFRNGQSLENTFQTQNTGMFIARFGSGAPITGVSVKNNLFWQNRNGRAISLYDDQHGTGAAWLPGVNPANQIFANNLTSPASTIVHPTNSYFAETVDPLFVSATVADLPGTTNVTQRPSLDFRLRSGSPAIDAGGFLTTTRSAGSGTTIPVVDAAYFTAGLGVITGDSIQLQGQTTRATVTAIDTTANTITVSSSLTWTSGLGVALAYNGSAPDVGAFETVGGVTTITYPITVIKEGSAATIGTVSATGLVCSGLICTANVTAGGSITLVATTNGTLFGGWSGCSASTTCIISNITAPVTVRATFDTFVVAPSITTQPANQTVQAQNTTTFNVTATGTAPLTYQWQKSNSGSSTFTNISGATSASYTTPLLSVSDNGARYRVVVSNSVSPAATSSAATLTVTPAPVADETDPTIFNITTSSITTNSVQIKWDTSELTTSYIQYGNTIPGYGNETAISALTTSPSFILSGLTANSVYHYRVISTDEAGNISTSEENIFETLDDNTPPILTSIGTKFVNETERLSFTVSASDSRDDDLTYSITPLANATINPSTGAFSFTPSYLQQGQHTITFTVSDGNGGTDTEPVTITVVNKNRPPTAYAGNPQTITLPINSLSLDGSGSSDPDGTAVSYLWSQTIGPNTANFSSRTMARPTVSDLIAGTYRFNLTVRSTDSFFSTDEVEITVLPREIVGTLGDADQDGIDDNEIDACPNTPSSLRSAINARGCPRPKLPPSISITNLLNVDLNEVDSFELSSEEGKITFQKTNKPYVLTESAGTRQLDLENENTLRIEKGKVFLDSDRISELKDRPATITLFKLTLTDPVITRDGVVCATPICNITSYTSSASGQGKDLVFTVPGFSEYAAVENTTPPPAPSDVTPGGGSRITGSGSRPSSGCGSRTIGFSTTTGKPCAGGASAIPGCDNRTIGFSTTNGRSCVGNIGTGSMGSPQAIGGQARVYNFGTVTLRNGSRGVAVMELQRFLNAKLNLGLVIDGKLGPKTIAVIKKWQLDNGLVPDGLIGTKTKARMNSR